MEAKEKAIIRADSLTDDLAIHFQPFRSKERGVFPCCEASDEGHGMTHCRLRKFLERIKKLARKLRNADRLDSHRLGFIQQTVLDLFGFFWLSGGGILLTQRFEIFQGKLQLPPQLVSFVMPLLQVFL